jgi:hypothetical protein
MTPSKKYLKLPLLVFRGRQVKANYHEEISIYRNNPLIEALPEILEEDKVIDKLKFYPEFVEEERNLPAHLRLHLIQNVLDLFILLSPHLDLEQRFSRMIRVGYKARNPAVRGFWKDINQKVDSLRSGNKTASCRRSKATGFTILGISGVGKSTAVQEILDLYDQVIYHSCYHEQDFTITQLVWLILECPADGSIKGLCLNFFQAVDDILKTNYYENYAGNGRKTVNEMMPYMALVASNIHLGVLVIDEVQRLTKLNVGGCEKILDFFVELINTIGLPIVLVGTYKAWSILGSEFRQIRRGTGQGDFIWDRMEEDDDWQLFAEGLWQYQYVQKPCELSLELSHALYYESQGITDFAVKVFMLAQARAITTGKEKITAAIIKSVAKDCLRTAREVLNAFKSGNLQKLQNCEDVRPIDIEQYIESERKQLVASRLPTSLSVAEESSVNSTTQSENLAEPQHSDSSRSELTAGQKDVTSSSKGRIRSTSKKCPVEDSAKEGLLEIVTAGKQRAITAYQALQEADYIRSATEYLLEDIAG